MTFDDGQGMGGLGSEVMALGIRNKKAMTFSGQIIDIQAERNRQNELRDSGKFSHTCGDPGIGANLSEILQDCLANYSVLGEEYGEAGHEMNELISFEHWVKRNTYQDLAYSTHVEAIDAPPLVLRFKNPPKVKWGYDGPAAVLAGSSSPETVEQFIERVRKSYIAKIREELVQVAAVTLAMIERLDLEG